MTSLYDVFTATDKVKQIKLDYVKGSSLKSQILFIYGNEADINLNSFLNALEDYPLLRKRIDYATFIGKRRWDLFFKEGVLIKLPMGDVSDALFELDQHLVFSSLEINPCNKPILAPNILFKFLYLSYFYLVFIIYTE